jgi:hypothetical protein
MSHSILKASTIAVAALVLGACDDNYYRDDGYNSGGSGYYPPGGYYPPSGYYPPIHDDAPKSELISNCKGKIKEKVRNRLGYKAKIDWGKTDVYNSARHQATINGKGKARNNGRQHQLLYTCTMNRREAYVINAKIDLNGTSGGGNGSTNWDQKAVQACQDRIRQRTRQNIQRQFSLDFTSRHVTTPAHKQRHVTGQAIVRASGGNGKISYKCQTLVNPLRITSASYNWTKPLPPVYGNAESKTKSIKICRNNLKNRLHSQGYKKIKFPSESVRTLSGNNKRVTLEVKAKRNGNKEKHRYECDVNPQNGRIFKMQKIW